MFRASRLVLLLALTAALPPLATRLGASDLEPSRAKRIRAAVESSGLLLQRSGQVWAMSRACTSCHHQMLGVVTMKVVQQKGFPVQAAKLAVQIERLRQHARSRRLQHLFSTSSSNPAISHSYNLLALAAAGHPAGAATDATVHALAARQAADGRWASFIHQAPLEDSAVTATALTLHALGAYTLPQRATELDRRTRHAADWLEQVEPRDTEDRVMQLLGLYWAQRTDRLVELAAELRSLQNPDGGWGQLPGRYSDAYATGQALVTLHQVSSEPVVSEAYRKGVDYLLGTAHEPTSWHVTSRHTFERQAHFESGYAHGRDQFLSYAASCWATMALAFAAEPGPARALALEGMPRAASDTELPAILQVSLFGSLDELATTLATGASANRSGPLGLTPLIAAVHDPAKVRLLLEAGADPNAESEIRLRAIHVAAYSSGAAESLQLLLAHGAKPDIKTPTGVTARFLAALSGHVESLEVLRRAGARPASPKGQPHPFLASLKRGDLAMTESLLHEQPELVRLRTTEGFTPLALAVISRSPELVRSLLAGGVEPNEIDTRGRTALHWAATVGSAEMLDVLLAAGADPSRRDRGASTPVMVARERGHHFLVAALERER